MPRLLSIFLPILSGAILIFGYPHWNFEAAIWLWLPPLLAVLWPLNANAKPRRPFLSGYLAGLTFFLPTMSWVRHSSRVIGGAVDNNWVGWGPELLGFAAALGLGAYCALYFGAWAWMVAKLRPNVDKITKGTWQSSTLESLRSAVLAAGAWAGLEWLRGHVITGFAWNGLGAGLHQNIVLIQICDVIGVLGLSFVPVLIACTGWNTLTRIVLVFRGEGTCRSRLDFTVAMIVLLAVASYGLLKVNEKRSDDIPVRTILVQPNVSQVDAWSGRVAQRTYQRLAEFTRMYAEARDGKSPMDLVIWPESALPVHLYDLPEHEDYFNDLLAAGEFSLLTGTEIIRRNEGGGAHVSAVLFYGSYANRQEYHKVHLVPFGEYLPFRNIPPFSFLQGVLPGDFDPGSKVDPLQMTKPEVQIIPLICFEDTVGRLARQFVREAPQMIVNMTNDGWFLQSTETEIHLINALFRAVELRRPMCRAANTGVSAFIDTHGRITSRLDDPDTGSTFLEGCKAGEVLVPRKGEITIYAKFGDWFAATMLALAIGAVVMRIMQARKVA